ncbi:hypothetical protein J4216_02175 [Candidatus Woesearchaeota archaeon]|nr:hypothetical protein [Candidatus Woesearchaeota archaeon]
MDKEKFLIGIIVLPILQFIIDSFYIWVYPQVNPFRALMIGVTALVLLFIPYIFEKRWINAWIGGLSIFSSAFFGALLVQAGVLVSKTFFSGLVHILILWASFIIISFIYEKLIRR